jgi:hypothetical protein
MVLDGPEAHEWLVPKLLLGNAIFLPQLGWGTSLAASRKILFITLFAKRSLASKGVPKQELGNQPFMFQMNTQNHEN